MFWKIVWAFVLLFFAFIAFERKWLYALIAADIAIALSHKTTAIVYILTLCAMLLWRARRMEVLVHIGITGTILGFVNLSTIQGALVATPVAYFLGWQDFAWFSIPFLIAIAAVNVYLRQAPIPRTLIAFGFIACAYPILHLPFYERIFVFTDIALAITAAYAISYMITYFSTNEHGMRTWLYLTVVCISFTFFAGIVIAQVHEVRPQLSRENVVRIEEIGSLVSADATILTSTSEAPWFEGWTHAHIVAPGMLRDTHSLEEWQHIWGDATEKERIDFLADFDHPLYISTFDGFEYLIGTSTPCLREITPYLLIDECQR